ncbi:MAG: tRNA (adenine-N(6)-)-methyltransferase [Flavobacteriaceae bacterium]|nr:MAG: tRNA (adenine-N(6)-)-methyltransferase [Flavobacteriaceae bacterium]
MSDSFKFKEFTVSQDKSAMKVGTDGVLLGAWAQPKEACSILDIGSGTGIVSLQMAQRTFAETIDAIEIDAGAFEQTVENFEQSGWGDRLFCYHASIQNFVDEAEEKYDFIISNPPFFSEKFKKNGISETRALARHTHKLSFEELLSATSKLLSKTGACAFIIPIESESIFLGLAEINGLFLNRITRVRGTSSSDIKRSLVQFSFKKTEIEKSELVIEIERHVYTQDYIDLVKDFYLKM